MARSPVILGTVLYFFILRATLRNGGQILKNLRDTEPSSAMLRVSLVHAAYCVRHSSRYVLGHDFTALWIGCEAV
jgi:hypothetical protein